MKQCLGFRKIQKNKAIAEYLGKYPADVQNRHGNAKITNQEYIRTSPVTKRQVRSEIETGKAVKQVFSDNFQSEHQPRDSKFVHIYNALKSFGKAKTRKKKIFCYKDS